jgi:hypothetical protein
VETFRFGENGLGYKEWSFCRGYRTVSGEAIVARIVMMVNVVLPYILRVDLNLRLEVLILYARQDSAWLHIVGFGIVMIVRFTTGIYMASLAVVMMRNSLV